MNKWIPVLAVLLVATFWGCDRDDEAQEVEEVDHQKEVEQEELPPLEGPFEGAHDPEEPVEAGEFGAGLVDSICLAYDRCRNEEIKALVFRQVLTTAALDAPTLEDQQREQQFQETVERLQNRQTLVPDREDCETVFGPVFIEGAGLDEETLRKAVDGENLTYDSEAAAECLAQFGEPFELCSKEVDVDGGPIDQEQVIGDAMSHSGELTEHFRACDRVFEGTAQEGEACRYTYECVDGTNCDVDPDDEVGECVEPAPGEGSPAPGGGGMPGGPPPAP